MQHANQRHPETERAESRKMNYTEQTVPSAGFLESESKTLSQEQIAFNDRDDSMHVIQRGNRANPNARKQHFERRNLGA